MRPSQKVIKILAKILAIILTIGIITAIAGGIYFLFNLGTKAPKEDSIKKTVKELINDDDDYDDDYDDDNSLGDSSMDERINFSESYTDVKGIIIENAINNVTIKSGDSNEVHVEMTNVRKGSTVNLDKSNGYLKYKEPNYKNKNLSDILNTIKSGKVVITIPKNFQVMECTVDTGIGTLKISDLTTEIFDLSSGVGDIKCSNIVVNRETDIESGVGKIVLSDSTLYNADISSGTGEIDISGHMYGDCTVESGVGTIHLTLDDSIDDYNFDVEKGLGSLKINGSNYKSANFTSSGSSNFLDIMSGIGTINIDFAR